MVKSFYEDDSIIKPSEEVFLRICDILIKYFQHINK